MRISDVIEGLEILRAYHTIESVMGYSEDGIFVIHPQMPIPEEDVDRLVELGWELYGEAGDKWWEIS